MAPFFATSAPLEPFGRSWPGALAGIACLLLAGCGGASPEPCEGAGRCGEGARCVFSRCRPEGTPAAPVESARLLLEPEDLAVVSTSGPRGGGLAELPEQVSLGREADGGLVVLFRFDSPLVDPKSVASAYLVLEPVPGAPPPRGPVEVRASRVLDPWQGEVVSPGRAPRLAPAEGVAILRSAGRVRVDVTELVRGWWRRRPDDHGIALVTRGQDAYGARVSLGGGELPGPRLEVYVK